MSTVLVWVLVIVTHMSGHSWGDIVTLNGDYATAQDCESVAKSVRAGAEYEAHVQCVQVRKVKP